MDAKEKQTQIGKVNLNLDKYCGQDFYSDGDVENELLDIACRIAPEDINGEIARRQSWPAYYHFSQLRENIVRFLPFTGQEKVLEVGSGCGAISGELCKKAGSVTGVDLSYMRSSINANRHRSADNLTIHVGNFMDIEPDLDRDYDYVLLIGVFEYGAGYVGGDHPYETFLDLLKKHLKPQGRLVIAIENKYGMKYFAGCTEDHTGAYFDGIENYPGGGVARTFSRNRLEKLLQGAGFTQYEFFYPYPDYKFPMTIFSERRLPGAGELSTNLRNFDRDRMQLFDEKKAFDGTLTDDAFGFFSNSFLLVTGSPMETSYVKYSNDREEHCQIYTEICDVQGDRIIRKIPCAAEGNRHIEKLEESFLKLSKKYASTGLKVNPCKLVKQGELTVAEFPFEKGVPLSALLDQALEAGDEAAFMKLFDSYLKHIAGDASASYSDFDLIFSNILVDNYGTSEEAWTLIDYEWCEEREIAPRNAALRALHLYLEEAPGREGFITSKAFALLKEEAADVTAFEKQEIAFQEQVACSPEHPDRSYVTISQMYASFGKNVYDPTLAVKALSGRDENMRRSVQIYENTGAGFSEEHSYFVKKPFNTEGDVELTLSFGEDMNTLRVDPARDFCMVQILSAVINGDPYPLDRKKMFYTNGKQLTPRSIAVFGTDDPNLYFSMDGIQLHASNQLLLKMKVTCLPAESAIAMAAAVKKVF